MTEVGIIIIRVIQSRDLPKMDAIGWCDAYFILKFGTESKQTSIQKNTKNPMYDESFSFKVTSSSPSIIEISCFDWDRLGTNDLIGSFVIPVKEIGSKKLQKWFSINNEKKTRGEVELELVRKSDLYLLTQHFDITLEQILINQNMTAPSKTVGRGGKEGGAGGAAVTGVKTPVPPSVSSHQPPPPPPPSVSSHQHPPPPPSLRPPDSTSSGSSTGDLELLNEGPADLFWTLMEGDEKLQLIVSAYNRHMASLPIPYPLYWYPIPKLMAILTARVLQYDGLLTQGIFRKSINQLDLDNLIETVDEGRAHEIATTDCHAYAVLLKTWLRRLEGRLIPPTKYRLALTFAKESMSNENDAQPAYGGHDAFVYYNTNKGRDMSPVTGFVNEHLSPVLNLALKYLVRFLRIFPLDPYVKSNLMDLTNITKLIAPNILIAKNNDTKDMADSLADTQLEIKFTAGLFHRLCITAAEEMLFERLDASVRSELGVCVPTTTTTATTSVRPVLKYYT